MAKRKIVEDERKQAAAAAPDEVAPEVTPAEPETHPHIDATTPHFDPTSEEGFDRPYDQWSNADLKVRAKQLGIVGGVFGHGELIDKIREAERRVEEQEAVAAETS